jgi:hypothetical protein
VEIVPFGGWQRNARIVCGDVEMIVTLEVGPRILGYGFVGGPNEMAVHEKDAGHTGGDAFHSYGGHRLWIGPEDVTGTYQPDNEPVQVSADSEWAVFTSAPDRFHMQKEIRIRTDESQNRFVLSHRIYNHDAYTKTFAPWTPTQFAPGGELIIPQHEHIPHGVRFLPARPLVLWNYTDMKDPRWHFADRVIRLNWMDLGPTKLGTLVQQGVVAYSNHGNTHLRRFGYDEKATYTDYGCNFETFTRQDMFEVETLGPLQAVEPGAFAEHIEAWYLLRDEIPPKEDDACSQWLRELASTRPLE